MKSGSGSEPLYFRFLAALLEVGGRFLPGVFADLDFVDYLDGASGFGHSGGGAFVLDDVGLAFNGGDASLYFDLEFVGGYFRFGEAGADVLLDCGVAELWFRDRRLGLWLGSDFW